MILKNFKVYHLFWLVGIIILWIGISIPNETLDINIHSTYFVISYRDAGIVLFIFYFLNGFGYWSVQKVLKKRLEKWLTIIHTFIIIGSFVFYWMVVIYGKLHLNDRTYVFSDDYQLSNITLVCEFMVIAFVAIPVYITNLLIGIFKQNNSSLNTI